MLDEEGRNKLLRALADGRIEWVNRPLKNGEQGFFRRTPPRQSRAQLELRLRFSEISYGLYGLKGIAGTPDDRRVQKNALRIGEAMAGQKIGRDKKPSNIEKILLLLP